MTTGLHTEISAPGFEPIWLILIKVVVVFAFLMVATILTIWAERRVVARMQQRLGPNRCGPFGILQSTADGVKLMLKEDIIPALADKPVFVLAPILAAIPAFLAFAVIPIGPIETVWHHQTALQVADLPVGILFTLACTSFGVYGIILAGWSSGSTYPLLGGLRSAAQVISYEIAMGLSLVPVFMYAGSLKTSDIINSQHGLWYVISLLPSFIIYVISMLGETNRAPFDLPEAEGELVGGFHTEYSSIKFAMFFLAEYINMVTVSAIATTLFLGGWRPIPGLTSLDSGVWPPVWFLLKVIAFLFFFIWVRGTLPRLRYDQFMQLGWKVLVPISLVWIMLVATIRTVNAQGVSEGSLLKVGVPILVVLLLVSLFWPQKKEEEPAPVAAPTPAKENVDAR